MKQLTEVFTKNNRENYEIDEITEQIIQLTLQQESDEQDLFQQNDPVQSMVTMNLRYDHGNFSQSLNHLQLINTDTESPCYFVSNRKFSQGKFSFELSHFQFMEFIEFGLLDETDGNIDQEVQFSSNGISNQVFVHIDFNKGEAVLQSKNNKKNNVISFPKKEYKIYCVVKKIGNFVSFCSSFQFNSKNNLWRTYVSYFNQHKFDQIKNWAIITNPNQEIQNIVKNEGKIILKCKESIATFVNLVANQQLSLIAFDMNECDKNDLKVSNPFFEFIFISELDQSNKKQFEGIQSFINQYLIKLPTLKTQDQFDKQIDDVMDLRKIKDILKIQYSKEEQIQLKYISYSDRVLLMDQTRFKLIAERDINKNFIISPFALDNSKNKVSFYLSHEEHLFLIKHLKKSIGNSQRDSQSLLFSVFNLLETINVLKDKSLVYYQSSNKLLQNFIQYLFLNIKFSQVSNLAIQDLEINSIEQDEIDEISAVQTLEWLFTQEEKNKQVIKNNKQHTDNLFYYHDEFDMMFKILFKIEESLFLQSDEYREIFAQTNRSQSSFSRLYSFINLNFPLVIPIEKLLDFGILVNSAHLNEFYHYQQTINNLEDYTNTNLYGQKHNFFNNELEDVQKINQAVSLRYGLNQLKPLVFEKNVLLKNLVKNGKFLVIVTHDLILQMYSLKYGFLKVFEQNLQQKNSTPIRDIFSDIYKKTEVKAEYMTDAQHQNDNEVEENKPKIDEEKLDQLYQMGFSLNLCKKALSESQNGSIENALNLLFEYQIKQNQKNNSQKASPKKNLVIAPEWVCQFCTLINDTSQMLNKEICQACESKADISCYIDMEEQDEPKKQEDQQQLKQEEIIIQGDNESQIYSTDNLISSILIDFDNDNKLNNFFMGLLIKRQNEYFIHWIRMAFSPEFIFTTMILNHNQKQSSFDLSKTLLQDNTIEQELREQINMFEEILLCIAPYQSKTLIFQGVFSQLFNIQISNPNVMEYGKVVLEERNNTSIEIMVGDKFNKKYQLFKLRSKSSSYTDLMFEFENQNLEVNQQYQQVILIPKFVIGIEENRIHICDYNFNVLEEYKLMSPFVMAYLLNKKQLVVMTDKEQIINIVEKDQVNYQIMKKEIKDLFKDQTESLNHISPKQWLQLFKVDQKLTFQLVNEQNTLIDNPSIFANYHNFYLINQDQKVNFQIKTKKPKELLNIQMKLTGKISIKSNLGQQLAKFTFPKVLNQTVNNKNEWDKIDLKFIGKHETHFSKQNFPSSMLVDDKTYFTYKHSESFFIFENYQENLMKIMKIILKIAPVQSITQSKFFIFVFNDLNEADFLFKYRKLSIENFLQQQNANSLPIFAQNGIVFDLSKISPSNNDEYSIELNVGLVGKYIGLLPLQEKEDKLNQIYYFGIEGDLISDQEQHIYKTYRGKKVYEEILNTQDIQIKVINQSEEIVENQFKIIKFTVEENNVWMTLITNLHWTGKQNNSINFFMQQNEIEIIGGTILIKSLSKKIDQVKKEIRLNKFEGIQKMIENFVNLFYQEEHKIEEKVDILELFTYLVYGYREQLSVLFMQYLQIDQFLEYFLQNDIKIISKHGIVFLVELLGSKECQKFNMKIIEILKNITQYKVSITGVEFIWSIVFSLIEKNKINQQMKNEVGQIIENLSNTIDLQNTSNMKIMKALGQQHNFTSTFTYQNTISNETINEMKNGQTTSVSKYEQIEFKGLCINQMNQKTYYIKLLKPCEINHLIGEFKDLDKLVAFDVKVYEYDVNQQKFLPIRRKLFDLNFSNQLQLIQKQNKIPHFYMKLNNSQFPTLFKIEIVFNHIPNFNYSTIKDLRIDLKINGKQISPSQMNQETAQIFSKCDEVIEKYYNTISYGIEPSLIKNIQYINREDTETKIQEMINQEQEFNMTYQKDQINLHNNNLLHIINSLNFNDFRKNEESVKKIEIILEQYQQVQGIMRQNFKNLSVQEIDLEHNSSFWNYQFEFIVDWLSESIETMTEFILSLKNPQKFIVNVLYNKCVFESKRKNCEFLIKQIQLNRNQDISNHELIQQLTQKFIKEPSNIYLYFLDQFIENLSSIKFDSEQLLDNIVNSIEELTSINDDERVKDLVIKSQLMLISDLNNQKQEEISLNTFQKVMTLAYWILDQQFHLYHKIFKDCLNLSITIIFNFLQTKEDYVIGPEIIDLILLCCDQKVLSYIQSNLQIYFNMVQVKMSQKTSNKNFEKFHKAFQKIVRENIIQEGYNQNKQEILIFCLKNLKRFDEISTLINKEEINKKDLKKEETMVRTTSNMNQTTYFQRGDEKINQFYSDIILFLQKNNIENHQIMDSLIDLIITQNLNKKIFYLFLEYLMTRNSDLRLGCLKKLTHKLYSVNFKLNNKEKKEQGLIKDLASLMIDGVVFLLKNYLNILEKETQMVHLCQFCLYQIINKYENLPIQDTKCAIPIRLNVYGSLFLISMKILNQQFNLGGIQNFECFDANMMPLFEIIKLCIHVLFYSIGENNCQILDHYFIHNYLNFQKIFGEDEINEALENMCIWLLFQYNGTNQQQQNPVFPLFQSTHANLLNIFNSLFENPIIAKQIMNCLTLHIQKIYNMVEKKQLEKRVGSQGLKNMVSAIQFYSYAMGKMIKNKELIQHFISKQQGLETIFQILQDTSNHSLVMNNSNFLEQLKNSSQPILETPKEQDDSQVQLEFGNDIQWIVTESSNSSAGGQKQWSANKSGKGGSLYHTPFQSQKRSLVIGFKLPNPIELTSFKIGLLICKTENYLVVGEPYYIQLYGFSEIDGQKKQLYLGELKEIKDNTYLNYNVIVYELNPNKFTQDSYEKSYESLKYLHQMTSFQILISRPMLTVVDKISGMQTKNFNAIHFSINFISVMGYEIDKIDFNKRFLELVKVRFFEFIDLLFNSESSIDIIGNYFDELNEQHNTRLFDMIQLQLENIKDFFYIKMSRFLLIISEKSQKMSRVVFNFLLNNLETMNVFYNLIESVMIKTQDIDFFYKFWEFGKNKLAIQQDYGSNFCGVVANYLTHILSHQQLEKFYLDIDAEFFEKVLNKFQNKNFDYNIERFLILILYYSENHRLIFQISEEERKQIINYGSLQKILKEKSSQQFDEFYEILIRKIWIEKNFKFLFMFSYSALKVKRAKKSLKELDLFEDCKNILKESSTKYIFEVLLFLHSCCQYNDIHKVMIEKQLDTIILDYLKNFLQQDNQDQTEIMKLCLIETVYQIFLKKENGIEQLEERIFELLKNNTKNQFFIEKILLKFFSFEKYKNVMFQEITEKRLLPTEDSSLDKNVKKKLVIPSHVFKKNYQKVLNKNLPQLIDDKNIQKINSFNWTKVCSSLLKPEQTKNLFKTLCSNKPFLLILECENQNQECFLGIYSDQGFQLKDKSTEEAFVPQSDNVFLFFYTKEGLYKHYKTNPSFYEQFLDFSIIPDNESITFSYDSQEKIFINLVEDSHTVDLYPMKPIDKSQNCDYEFPYDVHLLNFEIFQLQVETEIPIQTTDEYFYEKLKNNFQVSGMINMNESFFYNEPVYILFEEITIQGIEKSLNINFINIDDKEKEKKLKQFKDHIISLKYKGQINNLTKETFQDNYTPYYPVFEQFVHKGGMKFIIKDILKRDTSFLSKEQRQKWNEALETILELQDIEGFLSSMIQKKEFLSVIIELFSETNVSKRNWDESEIQISSLIFNKLGQILQNDSSFETKKLFLRKGVLKKLLNKLQRLTNEISRKYSDTVEDEQIIKEEKIENQQDEKEEDYLKKIEKRKGVGYDKEGTGQKWQINEYLQQKEIKNEFILHLLKLFNKLMETDFTDDTEDWQLRDSFFNTICESCLLPLLESAFKSASMHEIAKEYEIYQEYCRMIQIISIKTYLRDLLKQIPSNYKPVQVESILSILLKQEANTKLFKSFKHDLTEESEDFKSIQLAEIIDSSIQNIKKYYPEFYKKQNQQIMMISKEEIKRLKELPINEQYKKSLSDFRFGICKIDVTKHHYYSSLKSDLKTSQSGRMVRLAQEMTALSSSLPNDSYNAIFVRADEERLDVMKALIAGAEGTPYANGLFEYDVYLPSDYPAAPPKCNLTTTGNGQVRFNPNLYSCGKVCLSLLGTWRGNASENWDPKISNLLQLFMSIQAVVMSEEVYFNEPGYEGEAGTTEGEKKNEGYSNIVRLCNIKFAMIDQIKSPSEGFQEVIWRHFYLKRDIIMKEVRKWIKYAEVRPCSYGGLVSDHNFKYCQIFNLDPKRYMTDLTQAVIDLEKQLTGLVNAFEIEKLFLPPKALEQYNKREKGQEKTLQEAKKFTGQIDVTYDDKISKKEFDAEDKQVADRWSRYIGAMGIDAVRKQTKAKVLLISLNNLGLEIAKNIVLSGVQQITLCDWERIGVKDLLGNFYADENDIGKFRCEVVKDKLQQLNFYVKVDSFVIGPSFQACQKFINRFDIIVFCDNYFLFAEQILHEAEKQQKKIIIAETIGVYLRIFCDFGEKFEVLDRDGEEQAECFIQSFCQEKGIIELFPNSIHDMRQKDHFTLFEVQCDEQKEGLHLNESIWEIEDFVKKNTIKVKNIDSLQFKPYLSNGKIKQLKIPEVVSFKRYGEQCQKPQISEGFSIHDFEKLNSIDELQKIFYYKEQIEKLKKKRLKDIPFSEIKKFIIEDLKTETIDFEDRLLRFYINQIGSIHSVDAFVGGLVAQEIIKGITNKFTPIIQNFFSEFEEILSDDLKGENIQKFLNEQQSDNPISSIFLIKDKYDGLIYLLGKESFEKIKQANIFMVGAGAIGCELLKNYAMIGLGSGKNGKIILTDPDVIELSNLSRQFLFREKHIGKPKSIVAAKVVETMNSDYLNKIDGKLEKMCDQTEHMFDNKFFKTLDLCLNALDNVKARIYMDSRCVRNKIPLLESGTLGPKGHVQVIVPNITENYSQVQDATEENSIPICTLKMFPEEALHCMEWAKDRFDYYFSSKPKQLIRIIEDFQTKKDIDQIDYKILKQGLKFWKEKPFDYSDCIIKARNIFQKYFHNNIKQLLYVYPLDHKTKDGNLFWTLPKRPPVYLEFNSEDNLHKNFIKQFANLSARIWGIESKDNDMEETLKNIQIKPFKPKDSEIAKMKKEVDKQNGETIVEEEEEDLQNQQNIEQIKKQLEELLKAQNLNELLNSLKEEIFEKDDDKNGHIDVITAMCNLRSRNYKLKEMEWMQVKLKAGKIVPALATTTSSISALQTIEAIKVLKKLELKDYRNAFLNSAVPILTLSEPGQVQKYKIKEDLVVSVWDEWQFNITKDSTLQNLFEYFEKEKGIYPVDVFKEKKVIFFKAVNVYDLEKDKLLHELLDLQKGGECYLTVLCKLHKNDENVIETNLPLIRIRYE